MKRRKERKIISLIFLYLNYVFQKTTLIIFSISLILMVISLLVIANPFYDRDSYLLSMEAYHQVYFTQGAFVINIFNGILITTITILLFLQSNSFDSLFLANTKRSTLYLAKLFAVLILFLLLSLFEYVLLYGIPLFLYSGYSMNGFSLFTILYLFLSMAFDFSISIVLTILIPSIFSPMVVLFLSVIKNMVISAFSDLKNVLGQMLPILTYSNGILTMDGIYIIPIFTLIFVFIYSAIYNIKDIRIS